MRRLPDGYYDLLYSGQIVYREKDGNLFFEYREEEKISDRGTKIYEVSGKIPKDIQSQGVVAIRQYASIKVNKEIRKQKRQFEKFKNYAKNPNYPVSVKLKSQILKGRIIYAFSGTLTVELDEPATHRGIQKVYYGFASAMAGHRIFEKGSTTFTFTKDAIETARRLLIEIFTDIEYEKNSGEIIDLVKKLNQR